MSVNKAILIGNLGKDPEIRTTQSGTAVANFSLATSENYTDKSGNKQDKTEWHNIVAWGKLADIAGKYLKKGKCIYVEGKIQTRNYGDEGAKKYITEIVAETIRFVGNNKESAPTDNSNSQGSFDPPDDGLGF